MYVFQIHHAHAPMLANLKKKATVCHARFVFPLQMVCMLQLVPLKLSPAHILIHIHYVHKEITQQLDIAALLHRE